MRRTGLGLAVFTLALIAILLFAVGLTAAAAALQITDQSVDSNLHAAAENMLIAMAPTPTPTPTPTPSPRASSSPAAPEPTDEPASTTDAGSGGSDSGDETGDGGGRATPQPLTPSPVTTAAATTPAAVTAAPTADPVASAAPTAGLAEIAARSVDRTPESSDTFFIVVEPSGALVADPQRVAGSGLPDSGGMAAALMGNEDWRTTSLDGVRVRLLSEPIYGPDGSIAGALQTGVRLTAYDDQKQIVLRTILIASLAGLLGAAVVTWFVTRRAMAPIRAAFDAERRFVASASHELKTPVSVVRASAEILQREELVAPQGRYLVDDIVAESDRLGRLVGDLLALASAEAGQIAVNLTVFDVRPLVDETVERLHGVAEAREVRVEATDAASDAGTTELPVRTDRERLIQLLTIFIDNAIDHSPPGGVVRVSAGTVAMGTRESRVVIEVADDGPGVPADQRERIFEPFARAAGSRRSTTSTGLGLAIARVIASRLDATLAVRDGPAGGAVFSVSLPRLE